MMGKSEMPIAPRTILVLKRAPGWPAWRSDHKRRRLRVRIRPNTNKATTMNVESAHRATASAALRGSNGRLSEPKVKTAPSKAATPIAAKTRPTLRVFIKGVMRVSPARGEKDEGGKSRTAGPRAGTNSSRLERAGHDTR